MSVINPFLADRQIPPSSSSVHDSLSGSLSEGVIEVGAVVLGQVVPDERLATILVDSLQDLGAS